MIECEVRAFISEEKYNQLLHYFKKNATYINEDDQETYYWNAPHDLRIQKNNSYAKIWLKKGAIHDDARQEIEIKCKKEDFQNIRDLFEALGYTITVCWYRNRHTFKWEDNITVCIDHTKNYGHIIELEILAQENNKEQALEKIRQKLGALDIQETPKEIFNKKFEEYKNKFQEK